MRNLKRVLTLGLALVMVLGLMMTTGFAASKDFDDSAEIAYTEAVDVLTGIGVLEGDENGNFNPTEILTREQAAKIISYLVLGPAAAEQANANNNVAKVFDDVEPGRWSAGYIAYCANTGYIDGYGNGNYGPEDQLTGVAFAKLLLVALGYDADVESYVGKDWVTNVAVDAVSAGIVLDGVLLDAPLTREQAAQMAFQTLQADVVEYESKGVEIISTDGTVIRTGVKGPYAVARVESGYRAVADNYATDGIGEGTLQLTEKLYPSLQKNVGVIDAVGRKAGTVTVLDRSEAANGTALAPITVTGVNVSWEEIGYGASVWTLPTVGVKTREAITDVAIVGDSLKVTTDGTDFSAKVTVEDNALVYYNGLFVGLYDADVKQQDKDVAEVLAKAGTVGVKVDYIDLDNGGRAEVVVVTEYTVASVTGIANTTNTGVNAIVEKTTYLTEHSANGVAPVKVADSSLVTADELAYGDLVTYVEYNKDYYVVEAGLTTAKYNQINYNATTRQYDSYVIGDTTYIVSEVNPTCNADAVAYLNARDNNKYVNVGNTVDVYTDPYGNILHINTTAQVYDYLYLIRNDISSAVAGTTYATVAYADGTIENVYLSTADETDLVNNKVSHIYSYTAKGSSVTIKNAGCTDVTVELDAKTQLASGLYLNNSSVVVDLRGNKAGDTQAKAVYTGWSNMPHVVNAKLHYLTNDYGVITLAFLVDGTDYKDLSTNFIVYTTGRHYYAGKYTLPVIQEGEPAELELDEALYAKVCDLGVGIYTVDKDGKFASFTSFYEPEVKSTITWRDGLLLVDGVGLAYNEKTVLYTLDITSGNYYNYTMVYGADATTDEILEHVYGSAGTKMAYVVTSKGVATEIYVVDGESAVAAKDARKADWSKAPVVYNGRTWERSYIQANGYITDYVPTDITGWSIAVEDLTGDNIAATPDKVVVSDKGDVTVTVELDPGYAVVKAPRITITGAKTGTVIYNGDLEQVEADTTKGVKFEYTIEGVTEDLNVVVSGTAEAVTYAINYDTKDGSPVEAGEYNVEEDVKITAVTEREGYTFAGWTPAQWAAGEKVGDVTVTASWTENTYNLIINYVDAEGKTVAPATSYDGRTYTAIKAFLKDFEPPLYSSNLVATDISDPVYGANGTDVVITVTYSPKTSNPPVGE